MQDRDIEEQLKTSADKITVKSFSERWDAIKERISIEERQQEVLTENSVLATSDGTVTRSFGHKKRNTLIIVLSMIFSCILILSIVLPLTLQKKDTGFLIIDDLREKYVSEEQFYKDINDAGYETVNFSKFYVVSYLILTTADGDVKGGIVNVVNEDTGYISIITFYDRSVEVTESDLNYNIYNFSGTEIKYNTRFADEIYSTYAFTRYKDLYYQIQCDSVEDNCTLIFEEIFS